jgi:hypothetical protein
VISPLLVLFAADVAAPHLIATRTASAPFIDGSLEDETWKGAVPSAGFTQQTPFDGLPSSEKTTLRVLYDDEAIYFGFDCQQLSAPIVGRLTRRDHDSESDWVWVQIDSRRDGKNAVMLAVNVSGVLADGTIHDQTVFSWDWDENWEAKTTRHATGWSAEIRVPLRILRFDSTLAVQSFGMQAARYIADRQEIDLWAYTPRDVAGGVARFGTLDDLRDLKRGGRFELRPFALGRMRRRDAVADTVARGYDRSGSLGLDLKWHILQDLTFDAAVNPDFAQVEADQIILNLTNLETFLPEKRPLFLEGVDAFATPLLVFYSRRIGSAPVTPTLRSDLAMNPTEKLVEVPEVATIYGAGKLVGRLGNHWTVGTLSALTARNQVAVQDSATGARTLRLAHPEMVFNVLRLKRDLGRNAYLGVIGTGATVFEQTGGYPPSDPNVPDGPQLCPSGTQVAAGSRCFRDAYLAGVDGFWRSEAGDYVVGGQLVASLIEGGPLRQMPDGTVIGSGDRSPAGWLRIAKEGGKHLIWSGEYSGVGRKVDYNDLGFLVRQNLHDAKASLGYRTLQPGRWTLDTTSSFDVVQRRTLSGLDLGQTYEVGSRWRLRNYWVAFAAINFSAARFDDREIGDGAALERARAVGGRLEIFTDMRRPVAGSLANQTQLVAGGFNSSVQASLMLHFLPQLEIELAPQVTYTAGEPRFAWRAVGAADDYLFGRLLAKSAGVTLRATYTFTPRLTLQTYAQLFLASGHYSDFSVVSRRAPPPGPAPEIRLGDLAASRNPAFMPTANPDFEEAALNVNLVLRWEYRLGSTLFLVYSRSQIPTVDLSPGQTGQLNPSAISRGAAVDVVLLKLSYWWAS